MSKVYVRPAMLNWAIQRSGLPVEALERRFALNEWIAETEEPTFRQLETFARATGTPLGFLFLSTPPVDDLGIPYYRTVEHNARAFPFLSESQAGGGLLAAFRGFSFVPWVST